jgi:hypothetical protein
MCGIWNSFTRVRLLVIKRYMPFYDVLPSHPHLTKNLPYLHLNSDVNLSPPPLNSNYSDEHLKGTVAWGNLIHEKK